VSFKFLGTPLAKHGQELKLLLRTTENLEKREIKAFIATPVHKLEKSGRCYEEKVNKLRREKTKKSGVCLTYMIYGV